MGGGSSKDKQASLKTDLLQAKLEVLANEQDPLKGEIRNTVVSHHS